MESLFRQADRHLSLVEIRDNPIICKRRTEECLTCEAGELHLVPVHCVQDTSGCHPRDEWDDWSERDHESDKAYKRLICSRPPAANFTTDELDIEYGGSYNEGVNADGYRSVRARQDNGEYHGFEKENKHTMKKGYAISERFCRSKELVKMSKEDRHALLKEQMDNQKYRKDLERRVKLAKQKDENPERIVKEVTESEERSVRLLDDRSPDSTDLRADFNRMSCRSSPAQSAPRPAPGTPQSRANRNHPRARRHGPGRPPVPQLRLG